jgi:hypothetical protein
MGLRPVNDRPNEFVADSSAPGEGCHPHRNQFHFRVRRCGAHHPCVFAIERYEEVRRDIGQASSPSVFDPMLLVAQQRTDRLWRFSESFQSHVSPPLPVICADDFERDHRSFLRSDRQNPRDLIQLARHDVPPHPSTAFLAFDEARFGQDPSVVRNGGLALLERCLEGATTHFSFRRDKREHSQSDWIGERPKYGSGLAGFVLRKLAFAQRTAAGNR